MKSKFPPCLRVPLKDFATAFNYDLRFLEHGAIAGYRSGPPLAIATVTLVDQYRVTGCCQAE